MDEIVKEFLLERYESLERLPCDLVDWAENPREQAALGSIFRAIYTIYDGSDFSGFEKLEAVAHFGDNMLSKLRDGVIIFNPELASALLATVEAIRYMLGQIEITDQIGDRDFTDLVNLLTRLNESPLGEWKSDAWPVSSPAAMAAVAGRPDRAVVAPKAEAMVTPSATPSLNRTESRTARSQAIPPPDAIEAALTFEDIPENKSLATSDKTLWEEMAQLDRLTELAEQLVHARDEILELSGPADDDENVEIPPLEDHPGTPLAPAPHNPGLTSASVFNCPKALEANRPPFGLCVVAPKKQQCAITSRHSGAIPLLQASGICWLRCRSRNVETKSL